jgi:hypothetical protein
MLAIQLPVYSRFGVVVAVFSSSSPRNSCDRTLHVRAARTRVPHSAIVILQTAARAQGAAGSASCRSQLPAPLVAQTAR